MEVLVSITIGTLVATGLYLLLRPRTVSVVYGVMLLSYAANLFILVMGRLTTAAPPLIHDQATRYADPLPQALVLTAIVIGFGMAAFLLVLSLRAEADHETDHVDGEEPRR